MPDTKVSDTTNATALTGGEEWHGVQSAADVAISADQMKTYALTTPLAVVGNATAGAELRLPEDTDNGAHYVAIKAPNSLAATYTLTLPADDGAADEVLKTDGSGNLSWGTGGGGASAPLTLASGTITDPSTALTITATYNDGADTFKSLAIDITNTASAATSRPIELTVGGGSKFSVGTDGKIYGIQSGSGRIFSGATVTVNDYFYGGPVAAFGDVSSGAGSFVIDCAGQLKIAICTGILFGFSSSTNGADAPDTVRSNLDSSFARIGAGIIGVRGSASSTGGALNFLEQTAPAAPSANEVVIYAQDNGAGKTQLMARFNTGAAQQIAIEP